MKWSVSFKRRSLVSKIGKNTSQTGKQFRKYFYCFSLAEALLAEAEVEKTPLFALLVTSIQGFKARVE